MTKAEIILKMLEDGKEVTPLSALHEAKSMRLAAVIHDLRKLGYDIETNYVENPSTGSVYASYVLKSRVVEPA